MPTAHLDNILVKGGGGDPNSLEQQNRIDMLKKIKKARDLVFTVSKRRARRTAIGSPEQSTNIVNSLELTEESKTMEQLKINPVFNDYSGNCGEPSPLDFSRLKAKPWKDATHGRYKDLFNLQALNPVDSKGTRPMRMSPDLDYRVDQVDRGEDMLPMSLAAFELESTK